MKHKIIFIAVIVAIGAFIYLRFMNSRVDTTLVFVNNVPVRVEVADTIGKQTKGLGGRDSLPEDHGMIFPFSLPDTYSFIMRDMHFPLDIIWIRDGKIIDISHDVPAPKQGGVPFSVMPKQPVNAVLEVNAGWTVKNKINIGDQLRSVE